MTNTIDDGGPAFPFAANDEFTDDRKWGASGMSLRDWFAGQALSALITQDPRESICFDAPNGRVLDNWMASNAYGFADAMIKARKESQQ